MLANAAVVAKYRGYMEVTREVQQFECATRHNIRAETISGWLLASARTMNREWLISLLRSSFYDAKL